jgi:hypothetical protein
MAFVCLSLPPGVTERIAQTSECRQRVRALSECHNHDVRLGLQPSLSSRRRPRRPPPIPTWRGTPTLFSDALTKSKAPAPNLATCRAAYPEGWRDPHRYLRQVPQRPDPKEAQLRTLTTLDAAVVERLHAVDESLIGARAISRTELSRRSKTSLCTSLDAPGHRTMRTRRDDAAPDLSDRAPYSAALLAAKGRSGRAVDRPNSARDTAARVERRPDAPADDALRPAPTRSRDTALRAWDTPPDDPGSTVVVVRTSTTSAGHEAYYVDDNAWKTAEGRPAWDGAT